MATTLFYCPYDNGTRRVQVTLAADYDLNEDTWHDSIAEQCADDWHGNHDGFEARWPRVFALYADKKSPPFARFEVDRETIPQFNARKV